MEFIIGRIPELVSLQLALSKTVGCESWLAHFHFFNKAFSVQPLYFLHGSESKLRSSLTAYLQGERMTERNKMNFKVDIPKLTNHNYGEWEPLMKLVLQIHGLWEVTQDAEEALPKLEKPKTQDSDKEAENKENMYVKDQQARLYIMMQLTTEVVSQLEDWEKATAASLWKALVPSDLEEEAMRQATAIEETKWADFSNMTAFLEDMQKRKNLLYLNPHGRKLMDERRFCLTLLKRLPTEYSTAKQIILMKCQGSALRFGQVKKELLVAEGHVEDERKATQTTTKRAFLAQTQYVRRCFVCGSTQHLKRDCPKHKAFRKKRDAEHHAQAEDQEANIAFGFACEILDEDDDMPGMVSSSEDSESEDEDDAPGARSRREPGPEARSQKPPGAKSRREPEAARTRSQEPPGARSQKPPGASSRQETGPEDPGAGHGNMSCDTEHFEQKCQAELSTPTVTLTATLSNQGFEQDIEERILTGDTVDKTLSSKNSTLCNFLDSHWTMANMTNKSENYDWPTDGSKDIDTSHWATSSEFEANMATSSDYEAKLSILDSGCSQHMLNWPQECFEGLRPTNVRVATALDGENTKGAGRGDVPCRIIDQTGRKVLMTLKNALRVTSLRQNLVSVSQLIDDGATIKFLTRDAEINIGGQTVTAHRENGLYRVKIVPVRAASASDTTAHAAVATPEEEVNRIHEASGHMSLGALKSLMKHEASAAALGASNTKIRQAVLTTNALQCTSCSQAKSTIPGLPRKSQTSTTKALELVHSDYNGPWPTQRGGYVKMLMLLDDMTNFVVIFLTRDDGAETTHSCVNAYQRRAKVTHGRGITTFRCDNGGGFVSDKMKVFFDAEGITLQLSAPYRQGQNGKAERMWRTITERGKAALAQSGMNMSYLFDAILSIIYVMNRTFVETLGCTPFEAFTLRHLPTMSFHPFGCLAYPVVPVTLRQKGSWRAEKAIFLGYELHSKGTYLFLRLSGKPGRPTTFGRHDATFYANEFPVANRDPSVNNDSSSSSHDLVHGEPESQQPTSPEEEPESAQPADPMEPPIQEEEKHDSGSVPTRSSTRARSQRQHYNSADFDTAFAHAITTEPEPESVSEALKSPERKQWLEGLKAEVRAHIKNGTFRKMRKDHNSKAISSRFVFKRKINEEGQVVKYKVRLVAKGFEQVEGVHYGETYAPTLKHTTFRAILAVAAQQDLVLHQMDVDTAFLIPQLPAQESISMLPPPGFAEIAAEVGFPIKHDETLLLLKCIYGLKQASRYWNSTLSGIIIEFGFMQSKADPCLFMKFIKFKVVYVAIYVDDIIIAGNHALVQEFRTYIKNALPVKDIGFPTFFCGLRIQKMKDGLLLSQPAFTIAILDKFNMNEANPAKTPAATLPLVQGEMPTEEEKSHMQNIPYRSAVGSLLWLALTFRPDIAFAVAQVARFAASPRPSHWTAVKRIMRYLKGTTKFGIAFQKQEPSDFMLQGYSDSNWAGCVETRKSTGGYAFLIGTSIVAWKSQIIRSICLSSFESEIYQLSLTSQEAVWELKLFEDMKVGEAITLPITIFGDNQSANTVATTGKVTGRTKHIDTRNLFVQDLVHQGLVIIKYCSTEDNAADIFTKPLGLVKFIKHRSALGVWSPEQTISLGS